MHIKNARRILCLGPTGSPILRLVQDLTGSKPTSSENGSVSGLSHEWQAKTAYYTATVPIWLDEIADSEAWYGEFIKPEAKQVIEAIGAWMYCFTDDGTDECRDVFHTTLELIQNAILKHEIEADTTMLAIRFPPENQTEAMSEDRFATLEDVTIRHGFELIDYAGTGPNEHGEKQGIERIREALEANDWTGDDPDEIGDTLDDLDSALSIAEDELDDSTSSELKTGLLGEKQFAAAEDAQDEAGAVDDLEFMLGKLLAVRDQAADLPLAQRKRLAAKAVREVMHRSDD